MAKKAKKAKAPVKAVKKSSGAKKAPPKKAQAKKVAVKKATDKKPLAKKAAPKAAKKVGAKKTSIEAKKTTVAKPVAEVTSKEAAPKKLGILQKRSQEKSATPKATKSTKSKKKAKDPEMTLTSNNTKWLQFYKKYGNMEAVAYDMSAQYEEKKPLQHPKLGWGFILTVVNDRLEVLFQEGTKTLISNYNPDLKL